MVRGRKKERGTEDEEGKEVKQEKKDERGWFFEGLTFFETKFLLIGVQIEIN